MQALHITNPLAVGRARHPGCPRVAWTDRGRAHQVSNQQNKIQISRMVNKVVMLCSSVTRAVQDYPRMIDALGSLTTFCRALGRVLYHALECGKQVWCCGD